ncbi:hypothetical protein [Cyclobacterium amurskyense]
MVTFLPTLPVFGLGIAMEILFCEELEEEKDWNGSKAIARP